MTVKEFLDSVLHSEDIEVITIEQIDGTSHDVEVTEEANATIHDLEPYTLNLEVECFWVYAEKKKIIVYTKEA